jgi:Mg2+ and Co2+ transporter CorA
MNERIKELAFKAGFSLTAYEGLWEAEIADIERFAELVRQDEREVNENFEKMLFDMQNAAIDLAKSNKKMERKLRRLHEVNQELVEALEYHQDQTRPIQKTIDALAKARGNT